MGQRFNRYASAGYKHSSFQSLWRGLSIGHQSVSAYRRQWTVLNLQGGKEKRFRDNFYTSFRKISLGKGMKRMCSIDQLYINHTSNQTATLF